MTPRAAVSSVAATASAASATSASMSGWSSAGSYLTRKVATRKKSCDCRSPKSRMNCSSNPMSRCCCRTTMAGGCSRALASQVQSLGHGICTSRLVPQQTAQICLASAGHPRRARRVPQSGHSTAALLYNPREIRRTHRNAPCSHPDRGCRAWTLSMREQVFRRESALEYFKELVDGALAHQGLAARELTAFYVVQLLASFLQRRADNAEHDDAPLAFRLAEALESGGM